MDRRAGGTEEGEERGKEGREGGSERASFPLSKALIWAVSQPRPAILLLGAVSVGNCWFLLYWSFLQGRVQSGGFHLPSGY